MFPPPSASNSPSMHTYHLRCLGECAHTPSHTHNMSRDIFSYYFKVNVCMCGLLCWLLWKLCERQEELWIVFGVVFVYWDTCLKLMVHKDFKSWTSWCCHRLIHKWTLSFHAFILTRSLFLCLTLKPKKHLLKKKLEGKKVTIHKIVPSERVTFMCLCAQTWLNPQPVL